MSKHARTTSHNQEIESHEMKGQWNYKHEKTKQKEVNRTRQEHARQMQGNEKKTLKNYKRMEKWHEKNLKLGAKAVIYCIF